MSEHLEVGAEIAKLSRLLGADAGELSFLERLPSAALRTFRLSATDFLFDRDADMLGRVAAGSKLVPIPLSAKIAQAAFGPLLCAAVSGLLDPDRAVRTAQRLPIPFLADVAVEMDPRRAAGVIAQMPPEIVAAVGVELVARGEHVTMGRFVAFLPPPTLRQALDAIGDADLLRTAFVLEDKSRLDELMDIARGRLAGIITAAHEHDLWAEALDLLDHLDPRHRHALGDAAAAQSDEVLGAMIAAAQRIGGWDSLLPVTAAMSQASLARLARVPELADVHVLTGLVEAAARQELWADVLPLVDVVPAGVRSRLGACLGALTREQMLAALAAATRSGNLSVLLDIALAQDAAGRARVLELVDEAGDLDEFAGLLTDDTPEVIWDALDGVVAEMPDRVRAVIAARAGQLGRTYPSG